MSQGIYLTLRTKHRLTQQEFLSGQPFKLASSGNFFIYRYKPQGEVGYIQVTSTEHYSWSFYRTVNHIKKNGFSVLHEHLGIQYPTFIEFKFYELWKGF